MCGGTCQHPTDLRQEDGELEDNLGCTVGPYVNETEELGISLHHCPSTTHEALGSTPWCLRYNKMNEPILPSYVVSDKWVCLSKSGSLSASKDDRKGGTMVLNVVPCVWSALETV